MHVAEPYFMVRRWFIAVLLYLLLVVVIVLAKPAMFFTDRDEIKEWRVHSNVKNSIFSIKFIFPVMAIVCYYTVCVISVML